MAKSELTANLIIQTLVMSKDQGQLLVLGIYISSTSPALVACTQQTSMDIVTGERAIERE